MGKILYLVRHGQTDNNIVRRIQSPETPLNDTGLRQAAQVAERCANLDAEVIITSPFTRTKQTAQAIHEATKLLVEELEYLHENIPASKIAGMLPEDPIRKEYSQRWRANWWRENWYDSDEENLDDMRHRARKSIEYFEQHEKEKMIVVSHGWFLRILILELSGLNLPNEQFAGIHEYMRSSNTGITVCRKDSDEIGNPDWKLITWNDHAHLG